MHDPTMMAQRLNLRVLGVVQGVGFRPFVHRLATELELPGWVLNDPSGVSIEVEGPHQRLTEFLARLSHDKPRAAILYAVDARWLAPVGLRGFEIRASATTGETRAWLLPDLGVCEDCKRELFDPGDRRFGYPFLNCTNCGPRYTILESLPYDRAQTSMKDFVMCPACRAEYVDPHDRRFHAQPTACAQCGPRLRALDPNESGGGRAGHVGEVSGEAALDRAVRWIEEGRIVAMKGLGGFHLLVDATREDALVRLRERKRRREKPFAVMVESVDLARRWVEIEPFVAALLESAQAPIVLAPRTAAGWTEPARAVAPGCPQLGVFLPYTPLHQLLLARLRRPLVATSGNPTDDPTICSDEDALRALAPICDGFLLHDRPILRQADDSVVQVITRPVVRTQLLRRARGFAPLPLLAPRDLPAAIGVGAHMNVTFAVTRGREVVLSPHLGEMNGPEGREAYRRTLEDTLGLLHVEPRWIAHDLHPDYFTTALAEELGERWQIPCFAVQHHHAHLAAAALEHAIEGECTALAWDGTGAGGDGTVWGGEVLRGNAATSQRVGSIVPFALVGGEVAVHETWRTTLSLLHTAYEGAVPPDCFAAEGIAPRLRDGVAQVLRTGQRGVATSVTTLTTVTTSMGRLFDGVSALLGLCYENTHQAQAPQMLEWACTTSAAGSVPAFPVELVESDGLLRLDWRPVIRALVHERKRGTAVGTLATAFHEWLREGALGLVEALATGPVLLTGGVFCNRRLTELLLVAADERGLDLRAHSQLPPTDGAIAAGQVWAVASARAH